MLIGQYSSTLTDKRRIAIPKKFRHELGDSIIIAKWYEGCLVAVSQTQWQELMNRLTGKSAYVTAAVRDTDRFILGSAYEVTLDSQGRGLLPESLSQYAGLTKDVVFLGLGDRVELWDADTWNTKEEEVAQKAHELIEDIAHRD